MSARRCCDVAGTVGPAALLVLLPKCPACIAAWLAVGAGIGVTVATAAYLRVFLIVLCVACMAWVVGRLWRSRPGRPFGNR